MTLQEEHKWWTKPEMKSQKIELNYQIVFFIE